jgi:hypothetical protein
MNVLPEPDPAPSEVELTSLDLRYESCRVKQAAVEERLLGSIAERGMEEAVEGVEVGRRRILLNGFKRCRCARKLRLGMVPYVSLGQDEAVGIIVLLREGKARSLTILEQAAFLDELKRVRGLSVAQIALELSRSKAWVSLRLGLFSEMSEAVRQKLFAGLFPARAYLYTLRPFTRVNGGTKLVEGFVLAVSGRGLSVREIEALAQGYLRGPESVRAEIDQGKVALALGRIGAGAAAADGCCEVERGMLRELEMANRAMHRVKSGSEDPRLSSGPFHAQAHVLTGAILRRAEGFLAAVKAIHDRGRPA